MATGAEAASEGQREADQHAKQGAVQPCGQHHITEVAHACLQPPACELRSASYAAWVPSSSPHAQADTNSYKSTDNTTDIPALRSILHALEDAQAFFFFGIMHAAAWCWQMSAEVCTKRDSYQAPDSLPGDGT